MAKTEHSGVFWVLRDAGESLEGLMAVVGECFFFWDIRMQVSGAVHSLIQNHRLHVSEEKIERQ